MSFNFGCDGSVQKNLKQEITTQCFRNLFCTNPLQSKTALMASILPRPRCGNGTLAFTSRSSYTKRGSDKRTKSFHFTIGMETSAGWLQKLLFKIIVKIFYAVNWHWYWKLLHVAWARCNELINLLSAVRQILNCSSDASCCSHLLSCLLKSRRHFASVWPPFSNDDFLLRPIENQMTRIVMSGKKNLSYITLNTCFCDNHLINSFYFLLDKTQLVLRTELSAIKLFPLYSIQLTG